MSRSTTTDELERNNNALREQMRLYSPEQLDSVDYMGAGFKETTITSKDLVALRVNAGWVRTHVEQHLPWENIDHEEMRDRNNKALTQIELVQHIIYQAEARGLTGTFILLRAKYGIPNKKEIIHTKREWLSKQEEMLDGIQAAVKRVRREIEELESGGTQ